MQQLERQLENYFREIIAWRFWWIGEVEGLSAIYLSDVYRRTTCKRSNEQKTSWDCSIIGVAIDQVLSSIVDIGKVWFGIEDLEAVSGLPESILAIEAFSFVNEYGYFWSVVWINPNTLSTSKIYGKIEPLMGMKPRDQECQSFSDRHIFLFV